MLEVKNLNKHFDGVVALKEFSCTIREKEILGLIGPNGAGKTTLFNVLTGFLPCDSGTATFKGYPLLGKAPYCINRYGISRTFQNLRLIRQMTVFENVLLAFRDQPGENLLHIFLGEKRSRKRENENKERALSLLKFSGLSDKKDTYASDLSYGQQKLLSLVCCLASEADLLLLDEPVSGISPVMTESILSIIKELPVQGKSVILIEHNMDAVMEICRRVIFMDTGEKVSEGTPREVRNDPRVIEAYLD
jgi:ABC-type branched-subunit amino acid transport system ATPase component